MTSRSPSALRTADDLAAMAAYLRTHTQLRAKAEIGLVSDVLGPASWVTGPGDDGAVVRVSPHAGISRGATGPAPVEVIACGEALLPAFVSADPHGAGIAAVLTNVNDLAAMGAEPLGIVDTIVGPVETARTILTGLSEASEIFDVPLIGGHLSIHDGPPALSAFGIGRATKVLSTTNVRPGQTLVVAACVDGMMREDFPFFPSFRTRGTEAARDLRLLHHVAATGLAVAAKDVSMAGLVGSLAMLLEWGRFGATVDLDVLPRPSGVPLIDWLTCFPAFAFLLCAPRGREVDLVEPFRERGLAAAAVGSIDDTGLVRLASDGQMETVLDLARTSITGLRRPD